MPNSSLSGSGMLAGPTVVESGKHAKLLDIGFDKNIRPVFFPLFFFSLHPLKNHAEHLKF
jgi:hypothetical protein